MVPKPVKRKLEDELPLPNIAIKKAKALFAVDEYHGDDDELDYSDAEIPLQNSRRWQEDSIRLSRGGLSEVSKEDLVEEVEEVEQVDQGGNDTNEEDEMYLDSEDHLSRQSIGRPRESKQTWESNQFSDPKLDIYSLNAAVQLQNDLENLESELVIRDRIPWESFERELCRRCKAIVDSHLLAINRRQLESSGSDERDIETRPSPGRRGGFDYFLGFPTLEELAKKQRDIETLRVLRPISQKFALEELEPDLCKKCDKNLRTKGKLPAKAGDTAAVTSHSKQVIISSGPEDSLVSVPAEQSKQKLNVEKPAPASGPESQPPMPIGPPKIQPRAREPAPESVPGQPPVPIDPPQKVTPNIAPPKQVTTNKAPTPQQFAPDEPQPLAQDDRSRREGSAPKPIAPEEPQPAVQAERPKRKGTAPKAVAPEKPQPSMQAETQKRKGTAPKTVAPEKSQPPVRNERPKKKGSAPKAVAPEEPQTPAPGGKLKKKDSTPVLIAPKGAEPIQPAAVEKPRKKAGRAGKTNDPDPPPPASPKPATQEVDKSEDRIEEVGPIQRVMGSLPEKPKGHDYYCAICHTNLTRMGSAKKLEHLEKCGTTLEEVKVMKKAQAQAAKAAK